MYLLPIEQDETLNANYSLHPECREILQVFPGRKDAESLYPSSPTQSGANFTGTPNNSCVVLRVCFNEYLSSGPSFGRPRCDIRIQLPPSFKIFLMVGMVARMRLSSVTLKLLSSGTLKSTRISARLPLKLKSWMVFIEKVQCPEGKKSLGRAGAVRLLFFSKRLKVLR
jgi:hypothetical protein